MIIIDSGPVIAPTLLTAVERTAGSLICASIRNIPTNTASRLGLSNSSFHLDCFPPVIKSETPTVHINTRMGIR